MGHPFFGGTPTGLPTITLPVPAQVRQRRAGKASIPITGSTNYPFTMARARAVAVGGGTTTDWKMVINHYRTPTIGSFSNSIPNVATGMYRVEVETSFFGMPNGTKTIYPVAVGDNFISCGQSLFADYNLIPTNPLDQRIFCIETYSPLKCRRAFDPQPLTNGVPTGGSVWPTFGDAIIAATNVPIGLLSVSRGGSSSADWLPVGISLYPILKAAIQFLGPNNFLGILLGQGEADNVALISAVDYVNNWATTIAQSRIDGGWDIPWVINRETWLSGTVSPTIQGAQATLATHPNCFVGADFDSMDNSYRFDGTHLNLAGQIHGGQLLAVAARAAFGL